jgi:hypothetical protein
LKAKCLRKEDQFLAQNNALSYFNKIKATLRNLAKKDYCKLMLMPRSKASRNRNPKGISLRWKKFQGYLGHLAKKKLSNASACFLC